VRSDVAYEAWIGKAALVAADVKPVDPTEQPVVAVIGDGCFQMTCGEVAVARRLGLTLPIVVLADPGWP
jgi:thiamine pyrophosphate-dependent acetolactate synthase large subunit-like protein